MRVTLNRHHTHAGDRKPPGTPLDLSTRQAEWLIGKGAAHRTTPVDLAKHANAIVPAEAAHDENEVTTRPADDADATAGA